MPLALGFAAVRLRDRRLAGAAAAGLALYGGLWVGDAERARARADCRARLTRDEPVSLEARALGYVPAVERGRVALRASRLTTASGLTCPLTRPILATAEGPIRPGSPLRVWGVWHPWAATGARWGFVLPERRGIVSADSTEVRSPSFRATPLLHARGALAERLWHLYPRDDAALAEALVLARREMLDRDVYELFVRAGLAHLLAISGLHVGLLALGWLFLLNLVRIPQRFLFAAAAAGVAFYVALIGAPPSAQRAGCMAVLYLLTRRIGRPSSIYDILALAAIAILVADPTALVDPGFQLSFAGTVATVYAARESSRWAGDAGPALRTVTVSLAISAATFVATFPFTLGHFGRVTPVSIVSNLAAVPLLGLLLPALFASLVLAPFPALAGVPADAAVALLAALRTIAEVSAAPAWASLELPRPGWALTLGLATLVWVAALALRSPRHRARAILAFGGGLGLVVFVPVLPRLVAFDRPLEIVALDVEQGDAIVLRTPNAEWLLIDAGPAGRVRDAGQRVVEPYLRARGVRRVAAMILTHPDADHIGGATSLLNGLEVQRVLDPGFGGGGRDYLRVLESVARADVPLFLLRAGDAVALDGVRLDVAAPSDSAVEVAVDANEASAWFVLTYGEFRAAFTGDAPAAVEVRAARAAGHVDLLKVSHHGSATATSAEALTALRPRLALISVGRRNRYGHPHPDVLDRLKGAGVRIHRTDREGTIRVLAWPSGRVRVESTEESL